MIRKKSRLFKYSLQFVITIHNTHITCYYSIGEAPLSFGFDSNGKKCADSKFEEYGKRYGLFDVVGIYLVSIFSLFFILLQNYLKKILYLGLGKYPM